MNISKSVLYPFPDSNNFQNTVIQFADQLLVW